MNIWSNLNAASQIHQMCDFPMVMNLTCVIFFYADIALFIPTVLNHALFFFCHFFRVFVQQKHHQNRLQEAEHHHTKNPNTVGC